MNNFDPEELEAVITQIYAWSKQRHYRGYDKHDALNSPILKTLMGFSKWPRLIAIQSVMRFPINVRPLLGVRQSYNPKGLALFARGLLRRFLHTHREEYLDEAKSLLTLLYSLRSKGDWSGDCWGYHYPWQDSGFYAPTGTPNAVVSCFVAETFLEAYRISGDRSYLHTVEGTCRFFLNDLPRLKETEHELCLAYMPLPMSMRVMDVSILIAAVLAQYTELSGEAAWRDPALRLTRYVINQQTAYGAWYYTDPKEASHIRHDNYHTGFILDALFRVMHSLTQWEWRHHYALGLEFYAENLFNADGAPRWMSDQDWPHDIHGAAQGILTFSRHLDTHHSLVKQIAHWTLHSMYQPEGRFYYQKTRWFRKKFTLMRWCNAWMALALCEYVYRNKEHESV